MAASSSTDTNSPTAVDAELSMALLVPSPENRMRPGEAEITGLVRSIRHHGLFHRLQVRPQGKKYEILAGHTRFIALERIGLKAAPCRVHQDCDDNLARQIRLAENIHRSEPSAYDIAINLRRIRNEKGLSSASEVADATGMHPESVKKYLAIFQASDGLLGAIEKHTISMKLALQLIRYEKECGEASARKYVRKAIAGEISARDLERARMRRRQTKNDAKKQDSAARWNRLAQRIQKLLDIDPEGARAYGPSLVQLLSDAGHTRKGRAS